jgi:tetratricopeptide (TPR) repeat protein
VTAAPPRRWLERRFAGLVVAAFAVALYAPTGCDRRVQYDDWWLWSDTSPLRHPTAATFHDVFFALDHATRHPLGGEYLPVRDVSVAADMAIWGDDDRGPHLTQLLLVAACVLAFGAMLVRFGVPPAVAWLGMLIWAAHPIHVESFAWLSERKGVLAALLTAATALAWLRFRMGGRAGWLAVAAIAAVAATWSKAPAMVGFAAIAVFDFAMLPAASRRWLAIAVVGAATGLAAIPVVSVAGDAHVIGAAEAGGDSEGRVATALGAAGHYAESLALVRAPAVTYPIDTDGPDGVELVLGAAVVLGSAAGVAVWLRRRQRGEPKPWLGAALLGWAWINYLPSSHVLLPVHVVVADRLALVWSLAPCIGVAWVLDLLRPPLRLVASAAIVAALAIATLHGEAAWASSIELLDRAVTSNPRDVQLVTSLAHEYRDAGQLDDAIASIDRGLAALPDEPHLLDERARLMATAGDPAGALVFAERAAVGGAASALDFEARLLANAGRAREALPLAERAVDKHPELGAYQRTLAFALVGAGRAREAIAPMVVAVLRDPKPDDAALIETVFRAVAR